jgi:hypothetical protein
VDALLAEVAESFDNVKGGYAVHDFQFAGYGKSSCEKCSSDDDGFHQVNHSFSRRLS